MDSRGGEDFCDIFLGQVNIRAAPLGAVLGKKVQQITQLDEGAVVFLMRALVQQKIDVGCVPVQHTDAEFPVVVKHVEHLRLGKGENFHLR